VAQIHENVAQIFALEKPSDFLDGFFHGGIICQLLIVPMGEYFDTVNSSLNPHNRGHGFYVYGTLPMFIARYVVEWIFGHSGFNVMTQVGRVLSSLADISVVLLVYLVAADKISDEEVPG